MAEAKTPRFIQDGETPATAIVACRVPVGLKNLIRDTARATDRQQASVVRQILRRWAEDQRAGKAGR